MSQTPISEKPQMTGCSRVGVGIFGFIFFAAGCVAMWFILIMPMIQWRASQNWPTTQCEIVSAEIEENHGDDGSTYSPKITYKYEVDGEQYKSDVNSFFEVSGSYKRAKKKLKEHPVGSTTNCFYDPADPANATLQREMTWGMLFGLLPLVFILVGGGIMSFAIFGSGWKGKKAHRGRVSALAGNQPTESEAGRFGIGLTGSAERHSSSEQTEHPADTEDQIWDTPQKLKPEMTRLVTLAVTAGIAVFWNGLVSIFIYVVAFEAEGWGQIFLGLFLTPFVLVGLFLIVAFFHTLMALFNPKVEVALSTGAVPIGREVDVAWEVSGRVNRIRSFVISILGTQKATYRRGTDSITDEEVFEQIIVVQASNMADIQFGSSTIKIPDDTMHTFEADHNEVLWSVDVHGDIAWWPDIREQFPFRVKPA